MSQVLINKDTKIFGSFSKNPGNNGCHFFNSAFQKYSVDAIYKSFYSDDIELSVESAKNLKFGGFAISMPYKVQILDYLDWCDSSVADIGSCNTVKIVDNKLLGYNTDWIGIDKYLPREVKKIAILGNGGFSLAVQYVCRIRGIEYEIIERKNWSKIESLDGWIFNATPVDVCTNGRIIEARTEFESGKLMSRYQAIEQFKIYTGIEYV
jgi:shikimate dehydrogenase